MGTGGIGGLGQEVHLTKGQSAESSTKLGHEMSLLGVGAGALEGRGCEEGWGAGVHLTKGQHAHSNAKPGHKMSPLGVGKVRGHLGQGVIGLRVWDWVHLTKGQPAHSTKLGHHDLK